MQPSAPACFWPGHCSNQSLRAPGRQGGRWLAGWQQRMLQGLICQLGKASRGSCQCACCASTGITGCTWRCVCLSGWRTMCGAGCKAPCVAICAHNQTHTTPQSTDDQARSVLVIHRDALLLSLGQSNIGLVAWTVLDRQHTCQRLVRADARLGERGCSQLKCARAAPYADMPRPCAQGRQPAPRPCFALANASARVDARWLTCTCALVSAVSPDALTHYENITLQVSVALADTQALCAAQRLSLEVCASHTPMRRGPFLSPPLSSWLR